MQSFSRNKQLVVFFVLVFVLSIVFFLFPMFLTNFGAPDWFAQLGEWLVSWAPNVAAVIITAYLLGKEGVKDLLRGFLIWNVNVKWYVVAVLGPLLIVFFIGLFYSLFVDTSGSIAEVFSKFTLYSLVLTGLNHIIRGPIGEEAGWRGFALPRLLEKFSPMKASLVLGVVWSVWHYPYWFIITSQLFPDSTLRMMTMFISLAIVVLPMSIIMTWLYINTKRSLLIAMLFHFSWNFSNEMLNIPLDIHFAALATVYCVLAVLLYKKTLSTNTVPIK